MLANTRSAQCSRPHAFRAQPTRPARCVRARALVPKWDECFNYLVNQKGLKSVSPDEAEELINSGKYVLVDVRPKPQFETSHPKGAVNVPMYQPLDWSKPDLGKVFKFVAYASNGVTAVEPNPAFVEQMREATGNGAKGVITVCEAGGTLKPTTNFPFGKASRSLQAAYRCFVEGITNEVLHLDRGVYGWYQADKEFGGTDEYKPDIGRSPMAAAEPTLQSIRASTGYTLRPDDKK